MATSNYAALTGNLATSKEFKRLHVNCATADRHWSFLESLSAADIVADEALPNDQVFILEHRRLLHRLETNGHLHLRQRRPHEGPLAALCLENAPLLGLTHALVFFNDAHDDVSDDTCIPMFLFASSTHLLCDTVRAHRLHFDGFLEPLYLAHRPPARRQRRHGMLVARQPALRRMGLHRLFEAASPARRAGQPRSRRPGTGLASDLPTHKAPPSSSGMSFGIQIAARHHRRAQAAPPRGPCVILTFHAVLFHLYRGF
ncbi:hypothetical protein CSUB01_10682 [Colletotrichum sublineola]|uniref:Uncharacterized protein n=1 Tax=Colletotrichum sublineola TaxID=1173701 RepID=A0A066XVE7_COLSU|nr:hypothetical protein CSUB01_10682 [Colletotrichum sublineola]